MFYEAESFSQPLEKWNTSKVEQYKNKNKANSNISTQQTQLTKQPATNMIRCDDRKILEHIIQQDKNNTMNLYNNNRDEFAAIQKTYRLYGINLTSTKQFADSLKYNIKNVRTKSSDKANRRIDCEAEIETVAPVPPSNPIKVSAAIGYNARLMDNGEIILDARMINK